MDEEENGISFGQLLKVMFGINKQRKILYWTLFVVCAIICFVGLKVYGNLSDTYTADFNWTAVGLSSGTYIDGSKFNYKDIQSLDTLTEIIDSDEEFKSIDVEKLTGNLTFKYVEVKDDDNNVTDSYYEITANKKFFTSEEQAKKFFKAVAYYPIKNTISKLDEANITSNLTSYETSTIYDNQISYLTSQYNLLFSKYDSLTSTYGDIKLSTGKSISEVKQILTTYFANYSLSSLQDAINNYGYVKDYTTYETQIITSLQSELDSYNVNAAKISSLTTSRDNLIKQANGTGLQDIQLESYNTQIVELTNSNENLIKSMKANLRKLAQDTATYANQAALENAFSDIAKIISGFDTITGAFDSIYADVSLGDKETFEKTLTKFYNELVSETETYQTVEKETVTNYSKVNYEDGSVIVRNRAIKLSVAAVITVVVAILVPAIVNLILDSEHLHDEPEYLRKRREENLKA